MKKDSVVYHSNIFPCIHTMYPLHNSSTDGLWKSVGKIAPSETYQLPLYSVDWASSRTDHDCFVCTGSDGCIRIYREIQSSFTDTPSFAIDACVSQTHFSEANCIRWHPIDGTKLVSCGDDGLIKIWRYECS